MRCRIAGHAPGRYFEEPARTSRREEVEVHTRRRTKRCRRRRQPHAADERRRTSARDGNAIRILALERVEPDVSSTWSRSDDELVVPPTRAFSAAY